MKQTTPPDPTIQIHVLLADDDKDDRFFFNKALKAIPILTNLTLVEDGEQLMTYLIKNSEKLPNVLFLDLNMPKKNGLECLSEIKQNQKLKNLPVVVYSTSGYFDVSEDLFSKGAHYYFRKTDVDGTRAMLHHILNLILESSFARPTTENFILLPATTEFSNNK